MNFENRVFWIQHLGKKIFFKDYSNLEGKDLLSVLYIAEDEFKNLDKPVLVLSNFEGATVDRQFMDEFIRVGIYYDRLVEKAACLGIDPNKKVLRAVYHFFANQEHKDRMCQNREEALDYLATPLEAIQ